MPKINDRMYSSDSVLSQYEPVSSSAIHTQLPTDPVAVRAQSNSSNLMSITQGNSVPMRGILPIEQMTDADLYKFFPYSAFTDRIPKYTYYALFNTKK
jgi:hypothetical protein